MSRARPRPVNAVPALDSIPASSPTVKPADAGPSPSWQRQVEHIGEALGRRIRIEHVSDEQARAEVGRTMHPVVAEAMVSQWAAANGVPVLTSAITEKITGTPAHTYTQWTVNHSDDFR